MVWFSQNEGQQTLLCLWDIWLILCAYTHTQPEPMAEGNIISTPRRPCFSHDLILGSHGLILGWTNTFSILFWKQEYSRFLYCSVSQHPLQSQDFSSNSQVVGSSLVLYWMFYKHLESSKWTVTNMIFQRLRLIFGLVCLSYVEKGH